MATLNGKPLITKEGIFGRNVKYDTEAHLKTLKGFMMTEANKVLRTPSIVESVGETVETLSKSLDQSSFPFQYVALVSSLAKRKLGYFDEYRTFKGHIEAKEATEEEYQIITRNMAPPHKDIDFYCIVNETDPRARLEAVDVIKSHLPQIPQSIRNLMQYDIPDSSIRTPEEVIESFNLTHFNSNGILNKHESQFVDRSPTKDISPVIVWENINTNPKLKEEVEKSERTTPKSLRRIADYLSETIVPYVNEARKEIPEEYNEIVKQIVVELDAGEYDLSIPNKEAQKMFLTKSIV